MVHYPDFCTMRSGTKMVQRWYNYITTPPKLGGNVLIVPFLHHFVPLCTIYITTPKTLQFQRKVGVLYHFTTFFSINS